MTRFADLRPNPDTATPIIPPVREWYDEPDRIDLKDLPSHSIVYIEGSHRTAHYTLKISDGRVQIWRGRGYPCLEGPLEALVDGPITVGEIMIFPYFVYGLRNELLPLGNERNSWEDRVKVIRVKKNPLE